MALRQQEHAQALAKLERLRKRLRIVGGSVVAFSSGVDSTFLLRVAHEELGDRVVAATIRSHTFPKRELDEAVMFCLAEGVRHEVIDSEELGIPGFAENPPDRCYHCKRELFSKLLAFAHENGLAAVFEGSNIDDDRAANFCKDLPFRSIGFWYNSNVSRERGYGANGRNPMRPLIESEERKDEER